MTEIKTDRTLELWNFAQNYLVAGVSASTRVNKALARPFIAMRGEGGAYGMPTEMN